MIRKFIRILGVFFLALFVLTLLLLAIGVRRVDYRPYQNTTYFQKTTTALQHSLNSLSIPVKAELWAGAGKAGLMPPVGMPLAGYGARKGAPSAGIHDSLFVRVLALKSADQQIFIVGYDALMLHAPVARRLEKVLMEQFHIDAAQLLYTATHTHSGPGGWGQGWVEEQFAGPPDARVATIFVDSTVAAIERAIQNQHPAAYRVGVISAPRFIRNRLVGEEGEVDAELVYILFQHAEKNLAIFTTFSAHATVLSADNMYLSGDYPGYLERHLESQLGGVAIFAAAGLGSHGNRGEGEKFAKAEFIGTGLADSILHHIAEGELHQKAALTFLRSPFYPAHMQVRLTQNLTLAPWLAKKLFKPYETYLQIFGIDDFIIFGSPGEFSGELALDVKRYAANLGKRVTITSFNGCYIGYLTPSKYYPLDEYETKLMSWFGPYTGDYLAELMKQSLARL